jgi:hypothetical protein
METADSGRLLASSCVPSCRRPALLPKGRSRRPAAVLLVSVLGRMYDYNLLDGPTNLLRRECFRQATHPACVQIVHHQRDPLRIRLPKPRSSRGQPLLAKGAPTKRGEAQFSVSSQIISSSHALENAAKFVLAPCRAIRSKTHPSSHPDATPRHLNSLSLDVLPSSFTGWSAAYKSIQPSSYLAPIALACGRRHR